MAKYWIIDHDGTMFPETPEMKAHFRDCVVRAALGLGLNMTREKAEEVSLDSQNRFNMSVYRFIHEFGMDRVQLFRGYNALLDTRFIPTSHVPALKQAFAFAAHNPYDRVLLTYATRGWVNKAAPFTGVRDLFLEDRLLTAEQFDYNNKTYSDRPLKTALRVLRARPEETAIFEDSKGCLRRAHSLGIAERIYIHGGEPLGRLPESITHQYRDLGEAIGHHCR